MTCTVSLVPAGAGSPDCALMSPLMLIGMKPNSVRTQPLAPGAENELSTNVALLAKSTPGRVSSPANVGPTPVIGVFGGGGLVVPTIMLSTIGFELEPT